MSEIKPRFTNHCNHSDESFIGRAGSYDVYIDNKTTAPGRAFQACLRYGNEPSEYISFGINDYRDCQAIIKTILREINNSFKASE